jgi:putative heme iron utilization protein
MNGRTMPKQETELLTNTAKKRSHIHQARILMKRQHTGVLSTQSLSVKGYPFGSIIPFMMIDNGNIIIYASDIAQHSRNMKSDNKISLCAYDAAQADSQASARVTVLAEASWDDVTKDNQARYFRLFPQATNYKDTHDFRFYTLQTTRVRYIGGFGEIYWFSKEEWGGDYAELSSMETGMIDHMHEDHLDALVEIIADANGEKLSEQEAAMLTAFPEGFHYTKVGSDTKSIDFIAFMKPITEHYSARKAMVDLTHKAREKRSPIIAN